ncbi:hypothetical protein [Nostoc sp. TCL26-01]|uniref:hypothetical protein n=1 Tax=Nostoc sp. TCL26-01 TaxID=2576904 RepID=UPI0015BF0BE7|nr:hypothetical protein [Nostoc sp. TCL26-01]
MMRTPTSLELLRSQCNLNTMDMSDSSRENIECYGQTKEHAIALEQLADEYRQIAE